MGTNGNPSLKAQRQARWAREQARLAAIKRVEHALNLRKIHAAR